MEAWLAAAVQAASAEAPMPLTVVPDVVKGRVLSLDGDYLAYFMAGNDDTDIGTARRNALSRIIQFKEMSGSEKCILNLTASGSNKALRYLIATVRPYQANRDGSTRPKNWAALRDFLESYDGDVFKPNIWTDREADDGMALLQTHYHDRGLGHLIVSCTRDKDMRQYGGLHLGWVDFILVEVKWKEFRWYDHDEKLYGTCWLWEQSLQGDSVDGIPGLPKYIKPNAKMGLMGEKTAAKLLADCKNDQEAFEVVAVLYGGFYLGLWGEMLAEQLMLLWLRRDAKADPLNFLSNLALDKTTDNYKELEAGAKTIMTRVNAALEAVREIEERAARTDQG
ncbi:RNaseH [Pseudomonas phage vB_PpuP-Luke-3]